MAACGVGLGEGRGPTLGPRAQPKRYEQTPKKTRQRERGTNPLSGITQRNTSVVIPGRSGYIPGPSTTEAPLLVLAVTTPREHLATLYAVLNKRPLRLSITGDTSREAICELQSALPSSSAPSDAVVRLTITLKIPGGTWRDVTPTIAGFLVANASQTMTLLSGIDAPIRDMDLFLKGDFGNMQMTDSGGSYLKTVKTWPGSGSTGLLFNGSSGQAWFANASAPWTPVSDASEYVDMSGGGGFQLTPEMVGGDPSNRQARVTLQTTAQVDTTLEIRAHNAYLLGAL